MNAIEKIHTRRVVTLIQQQLAEHLIADQPNDPEEMKRQTVEAVGLYMDHLKEQRGIKSYEVGTPQIVDRFVITRSKEGVHIVFEDELGKTVLCRNSRRRWPGDQFKQRGVHSIRTAKRYAKTQIGVMFFDIHVQPVAAQFIKFTTEIKQDA